MAQDNSDKLLWLIAGAALGASIALLYAPQSGDHTRRLLAKKARRSREILAERGGDLIDRGRELVQEHGGDLIDTGRDLYKQGRRVAEEAAASIERGRKAVLDS